MATFIDDTVLCDALVQVLKHVNPADLGRAISNIKSDVNGRITVCEVRHALGEHADVWPDGIREHCESAEVVPISR